jgi:hypothetical protein
MTTMRTLAPDEVGKILQNGEFAQFIGTVEYELFECKNALYDLKLPIAKIELAKDVSALANAKGGYLLLGVSTKPNATHKVDEVTEVRCFERRLCDLDQYRKILLDLVYPPIRGLDMRWHPSASDASIGIVSIHVPPEGFQDRPYLVSQVEIAGNVSGKLFGFFERIEDAVEPMRVHDLRERLKDGMRYRDLDRKLENIESLLVRQSTDSIGEKTQATTEHLLQRAADTSIATGLTDDPWFYLLANPSESARFPRIFESHESPEVKLLENPPTYRYAGFDLQTQGRAEIVRAELIRKVTPGRRGLDLWRDGTLIFVGRGDSGLLGWACKGTEDELLINNVALMETVCLFLELSVEMFRLAAPVPKQIKILFELKDSPNEKRTYKLGNTNLSRDIVFDFGWREGPNNRRVFAIQFDLESAIPQAEAFELLKQIYNWFGFTDDQIPYVDRKSTPIRIDPKLFMRGG